MPTIQKISGLIFSLLLLNLFCANGQAEHDAIKVKRDSLVKHDSIHIYRIGFDLSRLVYRSNNQFFAPKRIAYEGSFDFRLNKKIYPTFEAGWQQMTLPPDTSFSYRSRGYYFRLGVDFNIFKPRKPKEIDDIFWGLRYGYGRMWDNASNIVIKDSVWGNFHTKVPERMLINHWVELVAGVKAEIFKNVFVGWTVRWRLRITGTSFNNFNPYIIPGFGYGSNNSNIGFNYYIFYRLPIN